MIESVVEDEDDAQVSPRVINREPSPHPGVGNVWDYYYFLSPV